MAAISPDELLRLWASERIHADHAIGQLVQLIAQIQSTLDSQRRALTQVQSELTALRAAPLPTLSERKAKDDKGRKTKDEGRKPA